MWQSYKSQSAKSEFLWRDFISVPYSALFLAGLFGAHERVNSLPHLIRRVVSSWILNQLVIAENVRATSSTFIFFFLEILSQTVTDRANKVSKKSTMKQHKTSPPREDTTLSPLKKSLWFFKSEHKPCKRLHLPVSISLPQDVEACWSLAGRERSRSAGERPGESNGTTRNLEHVGSKERLRVCWWSKAKEN